MNPKMNSKSLFNTISEIDERFIEEASLKNETSKNNETTVKFRLFKSKRSKAAITAAAAALIFVVCAVPVTANAIQTHRYNAAVDYLTSLGISVEDLSDYTRNEIIQAASVYEAGDPAADEFFTDKTDEAYSPMPTAPAQVTSEQILKLTPTMTYRDIIDILGPTVDIASGIYTLLYEVDGKYTLAIPLAGDNAQLGVTGEQLLETKQPIEPPEEQPNGSASPVLSNQ